jgi:hypothetical protein
VGSLTAADLDVVRVGTGPPVVLAHGSVVGAAYNERLHAFLSESKQRPATASNPAARG